MLDPAYAHELEVMDELVAQYQAARKTTSFEAQLLTLGMMLAQQAVIYKLSPPGGLVDVPAMFRREEN